jgi:hypothetical protein
VYKHQIEQIDPNRNTRSTLPQYARDCSTLGGNRAHSEGRKGKEFTAKSAQYARDARDYSHLDPVFCVY